MTPTEVEAQACTTIFWYYHPDHLGSSNIITDRSGILAKHYESYAFGKDRSPSQPCSFNVSNRFTGQILDEDSGLYYYNARYYDPELGRFIQPDTIVPSAGNPQDLNRYSYTRNNPLMYVDPTGHGLLSSISARLAAVGRWVNNVGEGLREFFSGGADQLIIIAGVLVSEGINTGTGEHYGPVVNGPDRVPLSKIPFTDTPGPWVSVSGGGGGVNAFSRGWVGAGSRIQSANQVASSNIGFSRGWSAGAMGLVGSTSWAPEAAVDMTIYGAILNVAGVDVSDTLEQGLKDYYAWGWGSDIDPRSYGIAKVSGNVAQAAGFGAVGLEAAGYGRLPLKAVLRVDLGSKAHRIPGLNQYGRISHVNIDLTAFGGENFHIPVNPRYWYPALRNWLFK